MRAAYRLLLGLIGISPVLLFLDRPMVQDLLVAYAAVAVALVGAFIRPGEARHLARIIRPVAIVAAIFAVWLMVQVMPLPLKSWAHPIWADAESALGTPIAGSITIDPGATLVAICRYFSVMAILFVATAVAVDRLRAEQVLFWLVGATTLAAAVHIIHGFITFKFLDIATNVSIRESTTALCALGVILAAAAAVRVLERYEMRRSDTDLPFAKIAIALSLTLFAFGICALSLVIFSRILVSLAAASGLVTLAIPLVMRRLGFGPRVGDTIAVTAIGIAIIFAIAFAQKHAGTGDALLRYASHSQSSLISMTRRIIADTGWSGTGAGTFNLLLPIYGDSNNGHVSGPSTAALIAIELGRPALGAILIMTIALSFMLVRGALQRGRDSFYPAAGAGCVIVLMLDAFCDASLFSTPVLICAVVALGLAFAQRMSRAIH